MKLSLDQCLDNIYYYGSKIFLSSYTSTINGYRSIFDYYAHILLLDTMDSSLFWQLPRLDQLRYLIWTLMTIYYITLCTDIKYYYYSDTFRFITNDPTIIIGNGEKIKQISLLLIAYYFSAIYLFTYDSFRTHSSLSMRTFIIYLREFTDDYNLNRKLLKIIRQKYRHYSHTTCLLLQYAQKNVRTKILEFKKFFSHIHHGVCIINGNVFVFVFGLLIEISNFFFVSFSTDGHLFAIN